MSSASAAALAAVVWLAPPAGASAGCTDGSRPFLTGDPFVPLACPPEASSYAGEPSSAPAAPGASVRASDLLPGIAARWDGEAAYGDETAGVSLTIRRLGRGWRVDGRVDERPGREAFRFEAEFKGAGPGGWRSGLVRVLEPVRETLRARARAEATAKANELAFRVLLDGRRGARILTASRVGLDGLRFTYRLEGLERVSSASGELVAVR